MSARPNGNPNWDSKKSPNRPSHSRADNTHTAIPLLSLPTQRATITRESQSGTLNILPNEGPTNSSTSTRYAAQPDAPTTNPTVATAARQDELENEINNDSENQGPSQNDSDRKWKPSFRYDTSEDEESETHPPLHTSPRARGVTILYSPLKSCLKTTEGVYLASKNSENDNVESKPPRCYYCNEIFRNREDLQQHLGESCGSNLEGWYDLEKKRCLLCRDISRGSEWAFIRHVDRCKKRAERDHADVLHDPKPEPGGHGSLLFSPIVRVRRIPRVKSSQNARKVSQPLRVVTRAQSATMRSNENNADENGSSRMLGASNTPSRQVYTCNRPPASAALGRCPDSEELVETKRTEGAPCSGPTVAQVKAYQLKELRVKLNQLQMAGRANLKSRSSASVVSVPAHCKSKRAANSRKTKKRGRPAKKQTKLIRSATVVTPNKPKTSPNRQLSSSNSASTSSPTYSYAEVARSAGSRPIGVPIQISPLIRVVHAPIVDDPKIRSPSKSVGQRKSGVEAQPTHLERPRTPGPSELRGRDDVTRKPVTTTKASATAPVFTAPSYSAPIPAPRANVPVQISTCAPSTLPVTTVQSTVMQRLQGNRMAEATTTMATRPMSAMPFLNSPRTMTPRIPVTAPPSIMSSVPVAVSHNHNHVQRVMTMTTESRTSSTVGSSLEARLPHRPTFVNSRPVPAHPGGVMDAYGNTQCLNCNLLFEDFDEYEDHMCI